MPTPDELISRYEEVDHRLDGSVRQPGIGVIVRMHSNVVGLLRDAVDVARLRNRSVYVIVLSSEVERMMQHFQGWREEVQQLAYNAGAERLEVSSRTLNEELEEHCRNQDIRLLMIEQEPPLPWYRSYRRQISERLVSNSALPPTYVVRKPLSEKQSAPGRTAYEILAMTLVIGALTALSRLLGSSFPESIHLMLFILALAIMATRVSITVSVMGSFVAAIAYDYITNANDPTGLRDPTMYLSLAGLVIVSLIISTLSWQLRSSSREAQLQERRKTTFFDVTRDLLTTTDLSRVSELVDAHINGVLPSNSEIVLLTPKGRETHSPKAMPHTMLQDDENALRISLERGETAGLGTPRFPLSRGRYFPIHDRYEVYGAVAVFPTNPAKTITSEQERIIETFTSVLSLALERMKLEEMHSNSRQKLNESMTQNMLLRSVSHDLKTPLTTIMGYANQLFEDPNMPQDQRRESLRIVRDESWRLTSLVNNLLSITKLESGALMLNQEPMFVEEVIGTAVGTFRHRLSERRLIIDVPSDLPEINVDPLLINQAIVNLVENAIKYSEDGTTIQIRAFRDEDSIIISVLDEGTGLPHSGIEKIFDKFVRLDEGRRVEGTGLGLAIVKLIVELHGGFVSCKNRPNKGAQFEIELPSLSESYLKVSEA